MSAIALERLVFSTIQVIITCVKIKTEVHKQKCSGISKIIQDHKDKGVNWPEAELQRNGRLK